MSNIETIEQIQSLKWYQFEKLTRDILLSHGYEKGYITKKGKKGGDDGIDVIVEKNNERFLVQSKCWSKNHGLINPIRELGGSLKKYNVERGIFFVSIKANRYERDEADAYGIELWDAYDILSRINENFSLSTNLKKVPEEGFFIKLIALIMLGIFKLFKFILIIFFELLEEFFNESKPDKRYKKHYNKRKYSY